MSDVGECKCCQANRRLGPLDPQMCAACYNYVGQYTSDLRRDRYALLETVKLVQGLLVQLNTVVAKAPTDL